ncbi:type II secretion system protein GspD [bacterium]|nr:type II secretion system protein GspD [bacterium]
MISKNIRRILSVAMLLAFTAPSTLALGDIYSNYSSSLRSAASVPCASSMTLKGDVFLTDKNESITLSLRDSDVKQVLRMFADKAGMNIVFHSSVGGKVTLDLVETPINEAFNLVLQITGTNFYKQGNTMIVISKNHADNAIYSQQEMMTFPINYVSAAKIADFLNKNVFGMKKTGLSGIDAATVNSATNELIVFGMPSDVAIVEKVIEQFDKEPFSKTFSVNHTTPAEMASLICNMLLPSRGLGTASSAGATGFAADAAEGDAATLKLGEGIVACSQSNLGSSSKVAPFDVQNLSIAYFPQRGTITMMGGSEAQAKMIESFIKAHDLKQPQALLEVSIVELNEQGSKEFTNKWLFESKNFGFSFDGSSTSGSRMSGAGNKLVERSRYVWDDGSKDGMPYQKPIIATNSDGSILAESFEMIVPQQIEQVYHALMPPSVHISWQMHYLIENQKARVLANPKIMITNGQESVIDLTQDYVEKVTSEYLTSTVNGTGSTGIAQRTYTISEDLGVKVALTPFISPEGYVTLNIKPEYSTVAGQVYGPGITGQADLVATLLSRRDLDLKNIRIKDGETLVIGGMIQETEQKTVHKIPFLGDLPVIGSIFRSTSTAKAKSELVIMITPKIINDGEGTVAESL